MAFQKGVDKWKLKRWFSVYAPAVFKDAVIGEIPGNDEASVLNRNMKVSLDVVTQNPQNTYTNLFFKITEVDGDKAKTKLVRMEILFSYVRSMVRKYRSISTSVIDVKTKDNVSITIKPIAITAKRETHSRLIGMRKEMNQFIEAYSKENSADAIIEAVISGALQSEIQNKLKHIAQLNKVEIRKLEVNN